MLWFCFFDPFIAGEEGIERFFRSWGGEALYNSHEDNPETGETLLQLGVPCIIKTAVPMNAIEDSFLPDHGVYRVHLQNAGFTITEPIECEGYSIENISAENIQEIIQHLTEYFTELTKCNEWDRAL